MRGSGWVLPVLALLIWLAVVVYPTIAATTTVVSQPRSNVTIRSAGELLATSTAWATAVAIGAIAIGWIPGRVLGKSLTRRGFLPLAVLMLVPICLPAYVVFYAWWQSWPAESAVFRWAVAHEQIHNLRLMTLYIGLLCWSWPIVAWCVAASTAATPAQREEMLLLDGAGWLSRLRDHFRGDFKGLALGGLLVFLATINNTTCFDLAEVFTFANELRAVEALGATARDSIVAATPAMAISLIGAALVWIALGSRSTGPARRTLPAKRSYFIITAMIWVTSVLLPIALFAKSVIVLGHGGTVMREFMNLYWRSVVNTITLAAMSGIIGLVIALGLAALWQDHRRWVRAIAHVQGLGWLIAGIIPGTIIGVALESAYNHQTLDAMVYRQPWILVLGHLASFGFIAALFGRWIGKNEPRSLRDLRLIDGASTLRGWLGATWPRLLAGGVAAMAIIMVMAIGETPVTAQLNPPMPAGGGPLALTMLNDMHYQRPQTVMVGALLLMALAIIAAMIVIILWKSLRKTPLAAIIACVFALPLTGCVPDESPTGTAARPLKPRATFGAAGVSMGQFNYPRCIDVDPVNKFLYVIDKSARVQRFGLDGRPQLAWTMPETDNGKPTGVTVAPDGRVFIADTHYFRIVAYDSQGQELMRFGKYGEGPMQFIYPTDIAFGPQGYIYVSEYGGHDRIQVFDISGGGPEAKYVFEFGTFGSEQGQFSRPQSIAFNADKTELFIADACNHRIVVTDPQGKWLRSFSSAGRGPEELTYPYGLTMLDDGTIMVAEFGNNRIHHFDAQGRTLGVYGRVGRNQGELQYPWGVAHYGDQIFVLDSGNNRVQVIRTP